MRFNKFINEGHKAIRLAGTEPEKVYEIITMLFKDCKEYLKDLKGSNDPLYRGARGGDITLITPRSDREPKDMSRELHELFDTVFYDKFGWNPRSEGVFCSGSYDQASGYGSSVYTVWPIGKYDFVYSDNINDLYSSSDSLNDKVSYGEDSWYDDFEEDWESEYGEGEYSGSWYYNDTDTNENVKRDALDVVADWERESKEFETEEEEAEFNPFDYISEDDLEWVPEEEKEDWINNKIEDRKYEIEDEAKDFVRDFTNDNIKNAISSHNEVMLSCKSYYLIDDKFTYDIYKQIKLGPPSKQKQLKFQFTYKKRRRK